MMSEEGKGEERRRPNRQEETSTQTDRQDQEMLDKTITADDPKNSQ